MKKKKKKEALNVHTDRHGDCVHQFGHDRPVAELERLQMVPRGYGGSTRRKRKSATMVVHPASRKVSLFFPHHHHHRIRGSAGKDVVHTSCRYFSGQGSALSPSPVRTNTLPSISSATWITI